MTVSSNATSILTFGYGKRSLDDCLALLQQHDIGYVVDVRSVPWSRFKPEFSRDALDASLRHNGLTYIFMGAELGGRPEDPACYDADGHVDYLACRRRPQFMEGIQRLLRASADGYRVAVMCSEGRPETCHRTKLVAEVLCEHGVDVRHLDETGELCSHEEILDRMRASQLDLLGGEYEGSMRRSRRRYAQVVQS
jgi:uncharacterized protein (DUF488 family)